MCPARQSRGLVKAGARGARRFPRVNRAGSFFRSLEEPHSGRHRPSRVIHTRGSGCLENTCATGTPYPARVIDTRDFRNEVVQRERYPSSFIHERNKNDNNETVAEEGSVYQ